MVTVTSTGPGYWRSAALALFLAAALAGCATTSAPQTVEQPNEATGESSSDDRTTDVSDLEPLLESGERALGRGQIAEAVERFVTVLAADPDASTAAGAGASERLAELAAGLRLEPGSAWVDQSGNQRSGDARVVGREGSLYPEVVLTLNLGGGRSVVPDLPVRFRFVQGQGLLNRIVTTSEFGQANTVIIELEEDLDKYIVEAMPVVTVDGYEYKFQTVTREFTYTRGLSTVALVGADRRVDGTSAAGGAAATVDALFAALETSRTGGTYYPVDAAQVGEDLERLLAGDREALRRIGDTAQAAYIMIITVDTNRVGQVELDGQAYNIFQFFGSGSIRLIRSADGEVLFTTATEEIRGQGNNTESAERDGRKNVREALAALVETSAAAIREAIQN